jgi:hypothetical protein
MVRKIKRAIKVGDILKFKANKKLVEEYKEARYKVVEIQKDEYKVKKVGFMGKEMTIPKGLLRLV